MINHKLLKRSRGQVVLVFQVEINGNFCV